MIRLPSAGIGLWRCLSAARPEGGEEHGDSHVAIWPSQEINGSEKGYRHLEDLSIERILSPTSFQTWAIEPPCHNYVVEDRARVVNSAR